MFTLLHISDLHRSPNDPIENEQLLSVLLADRDRYVYETPSVRAPEAAIVSGDIIQGVPSNTKEFSAELKKQYDVAYDFLSRLTDRLFDGDRRKLVLVPGNHDVCWNTAEQAMVELTTENPPIKASPEKFGASSDLRWSWKTRKIFKIQDVALYRRRLDPYWDFLERFYVTAELPHRIDRSRGFNLFELDGGRVVVAALESVHGNDCFCRQGAIDKSVLATCAMAIRDLPQPPILQAAVWHHSVQGPPQSDDYMDVVSVHEMIGDGFRIGFHGHQHIADAAAYAIHLPEEVSMAISSAGSLCAGKSELPRGVDREYNIVTIGDNYESARLHVRAMMQGNHFGKSGRGMFHLDGSVDLNWTLPLDRTSGTKMDEQKFVGHLIVRAEDALHANRANEASELLERISRPLVGHPRAIYVEALRKSGQTNKLAHFLRHPLTTAEFIELFGAYLAMDSWGEASSLLSQNLMDLPKSVLLDLEENLANRKLLRGRV